MKKKTGVERILGRKLARELRGEELARARGTYAPMDDGGGGGVTPIKTTTASQPPDTITDGYVA
ncbi:MAG TPA: hypothetical protein VHC97_02800 [Thermoanaerobaculia bacterium]|jgi:hypothetical protein|nr:hypothetical protein [Thermoanaerobaculia bacterium]